MSIQTVSRNFDRSVVNMNIRKIVLTALILGLANTMWWPAASLEAAVPTTDFRLVFLTNTPIQVDPGTGSVATTSYYDNHITSEASAALSILPSSTWQALISTGNNTTIPLLGVRTHTNTDPIIDAATSVPIYMLDSGGNYIPIATSYADLWDGVIGIPFGQPINLNQFGNSGFASSVWTGSNALGDILVPAGFADQTTVGTSGQSGGGWMSVAISVDTNALPLYGISGTLSPSSIPEPSTLLLATLGLLLLPTRRKRM